MADVDPETIERAVRWCAEAGRHAVPAEIRRALAALSWDELLVAKALLADPPPVRPLGPSALVDIARGAPPEVAAEREREGRYLHEDEECPAPTAAAVSRRARPSRGKGAAVFIRRARDRVPPPSPTRPQLPALDALRLPEGRALLERLFRRTGGRRAALASELGLGWRRADGATPTDADLDSLLDHHGLARAFARRERDEILHALRASGGVLAAAAERIGLAPAGLEAALARLGATEEAERIREERRSELRRRATLTERARLVLSDAARLRDLGLLAEFEEDLRARLPEHVRALRAGGERIGPALARSLSVTRADADELASRLGIELGGSRPERPRDGRKPAPERTTRRPAPRRTSPRPSGRGRRTRGPR